MSTARNGVFIDGAFDRQSSADPLISDQVVLASGASLHSDLDTLVSLTRCRVEQLTLSEMHSRSRGDGPAMPRQDPSPFPGASWKH